MRYWSKQVLLFGLHGLIHPVGRPHVLVRLTVCLRFAQWLSTLARDCTRTCVGRLRHCCTEMRTRGVLYRIGGLIEYVNLVCGRNGRRGVSAEIGAALRYGMSPAHLAAICAVRGRRDMFLCSHAGLSNCATLASTSCSLFCLWTHRVLTRRPRGKITTVDRAHSALCFHAHA